MLERLLKRKASKTENAPSGRDPLTYSSASYTPPSNRVSAKLAKKLQKDVKRNKVRRQAERKESFAIAKLNFPNRGFSLDGAIVEVSQFGLTFRPASHYLECRKDAAIQIEFEDIRKNGIIRSSRFDGYGIQLLDKLTHSELELILSADETDIFSEAS